ncbi:hypothetical protein ACFZB9_19400 [Kitasatospora sp. NPDC008050]|uniref:hypothetical protein n=1 Tax=Kitasatospora sp. NPDC008050 TaxID=3364021 RepID=UPI0036EA072F
MVATEVTWPAGEVTDCEEVEGTLGQAPEATLLVQDAAEVAALDLPEDADVAYVTRTTLAVDEISEVIAALKKRFPDLRGTGAAP